MPKRSTAKKIKDLNNYSGEVGLFELSKEIKKKNFSSKFVIAARYQPTSGEKNTTIWFANSVGSVNILQPIVEISSSNMTDAFNQLGYKLV